MKEASIDISMSLVADAYRLLATNNRLVDGLEAIVKFIDAVAPKPSKEMHSIRAIAQELINDAKAARTDPPAGT